jgi:hypothetical protein
MSSDVDALCSCGHRNPEHSLCGPCHGCRHCDDDASHVVDHLHDYERCGCPQFQPLTEFDVDALLLEPLA